MPDALAPYPSPEQRDAELAALTAAARGEVIRYGQSVAGRPLLAARLPAIGAPAAGVPTRVLCTGNIHGVEYVSSRVAMGVLAAVSALEPLRRLREQAEIWIIPCLNPDGYARTWEAAGRGTLRELRVNARGVDLNRNFPLPPGQRRLPWPGAGSGRPRARTYRGPQPLSEPETAALATLLAETPFRAAANGHSFMGRLIPARTVDPGAYRTFAALCAHFRSAQPERGYPRLASLLLDTFTGELEDFQHHVHGTWAICVESFPIGASLRQHAWAPSLFWRFNPRIPARWVDNDVPGIAAFLNAALDAKQGGSVEPA